MVPSGLRTKAAASLRYMISSPALRRLAYSSGSSALDSAWTLIWFSWRWWADVAGSSTAGRDASGHPAGQLPFDVRTKKRLAAPCYRRTKREYVATRRSRLFMSLISHTSNRQPPVAANGQLRPIAVLRSCSAVDAVPPIRCAVGRGCRLASSLLLLSRPALATLASGDLLLMGAVGPPGPAFDVQAACRQGTQRRLAFELRDPGADDGEFALDRRQLLDPAGELLAWFGDDDGAAVGPELAVVRPVQVRPRLWSDHVVAVGGALRCADRGLIGVRGGNLGVNERVDRVVETVGVQPRDDAGQLGRQRYGVGRQVREDGTPLGAERSHFVVCFAGLPAAPPEQTVALLGDQDGVSCLPQVGMPGLPDLGLQVGVVGLERLVEVLDVTRRLEPPLGRGVVGSTQALAPAGVARSDSRALLQGVAFGEKP